MDFAGGFIGADWESLLEQDIAGVYVVPQFEGGDASVSGSPVDNGPVDGRCAAVLWGEAEPWKELTVPIGGIFCKTTSGSMHERRRRSGGRAAERAWSSSRKAGAFNLSG